MTKKEMLENTFIYCTPITKKVRLAIAKKNTNICDEYRVLEEDEMYSILCVLIDYFDSNKVNGCVSKNNATGVVSKYKFSKEQIEVKDD